ncbi:MULTISPECIES: hypothetical protein [unclassified Sphingopyxis]|uniref:hypothetical protein n=1 Tax=unclassified Sphingopyxis TaxID=2614943 RepID=UPI0012E3B19E|nr:MULTISPECIES: hypothetical protein [unclassified Sphingopyxis]
MNDELNPPWLAFPEIPAGAVGWRTGQGELFWDMFYKFFSALNHRAADDYVRRYPEPEMWRGTYAMIRANPWK